MITFRIDSRSGVPRYRQIQDQVRYGIASKQLSPGEQLPTVRALAVELSVNPNTVIRAYSQLESEGLLTSEQGTGTFIAEAPVGTLSRAERSAKLAGLAAEFLSQAARYGFSPAEVSQAIQTLIARSDSR
jgi:GntR family transcriptional regulator